MATKALANALKIRNLLATKEINSMLAPLNNQRNKISLSSKALSVLSNNIKQNSIKYQKDIEHHFNKIIEQILLKKQYLFNKISLIEQKKLSEIDKQHESLNKFQKIICDAVVSCNSIINNKTNNLKAAEKRQKIRQITNNTLKQTTLPSNIAVRDKIKCIFNDKINTSSFISSLCVVSDNTLKPLPMITHLKCDSITHESATIRWNAELSANYAHKISSDLYMTLSVNIDGDDEKEIDNIHNDILFDESKQEYLCNFQRLSPNKKYKIRINCTEIDKYKNKLERTDFETVCVAFKTKQQPLKMRLFKFQSGYSGHETMKVCNDGLSVTGYGQLRFGEYLKAEHKQIYQVTFSMKNVNAEDCGIGFATKGFINTHNNHRMVVYGNTKILMAKEFKNGKKLSKVFWDKTDEVMIEINMKKRQGIMYRKFKNDIGIDSYDEFYKIGLPDVVAICVRFATNTTQTLTVVSQKFV